MRTLRSGNEYVLIRPYTTEDGKTIDTGQICQYSDGYLMTYDSTNTYVKFKADGVPDDDLLLYNETPYNREYRERRERIATAAMQGIWSNEIQIRAIIEKMSEEGAEDIGAATRRRIAQLAVAQANALIDELIKQGD